MARRVEIRRQLANSHVKILRREIGAQSMEDLIDEMQKLYEDVAKAEIDDRRLR